MKVRGKNNSDWKTLEECENESMIGKKKWYDLIPIDKIKDGLPMLKYVRGAKSKIQFDGFLITAQNNQAIFDRGKGIFHSRSQIDRIAWYIGSKILQLIFDKEHKVSNDKLTKLMESQEKENMLYDQFKIIKVSFEKLIEKHIQGYVTAEELKKKAMEFLKVFEEPENVEKVKQILEELLSESSIIRVKGRLRKEKSRKNACLDVLFSDDKKQSEPQNGELRI